MTTIEQELAILSQRYYEDFPQRVQRVCTAIQEGRMLPWTYVEGPCGCFYGHFTDLVDPDDAARLSMQVYAILKGEDQEQQGDEFIFTPIEDLLANDIIQGKTHETSEALATLYKALEPYVEAKREEALHG